MWQHIKSTRFQSFSKDEGKKTLLPLRRKKRQIVASIAGGSTTSRTFRDIQVFVLSQGLISNGITIRRWTKRSLWNIFCKLCSVVSSWLVTSYDVCAGPTPVFSCVFANAELSRGLPHYLSKMPSGMPALGRMVAKTVVAYLIVPAEKWTRPNFWRSVQWNSALRPINLVTSLSKPLYSDPDE